jgi:hypothetical protein
MQCRERSRLYDAADGARGLDGLMAENQSGGTKPAPIAPREIGKMGYK